MNYVLLLMKCRLTAIRLTSKSLAWLLSRSERLSESTAKLCIQLFHSMGVKDVSMQVIDIAHRVSACKASSRPNPIIFKFFRRQVKWWQHRTGTAEGEGLVGPRPHHFFAPPPPLFALKRKIIKIKKDLKQVFFPSIFRYILCIFFNFKRQAFFGAPVLFAVIVPWGRLAPWSNAMLWPPLRFVRQRVLYFQLRQSFLSVLSG